MSKKRISATVDPDIANFVQRDDVNASGLVNKLLKQHMNGDAAEEHMLRLRLEQIESDIDDLENRIETKRQERGRLQERINEFETNKQAAYSEAADKLSPGDFQTGMLKVNYWADELDMSPEELQVELEKRWENNDT